MSVHIDIYNSTSWSGKGVFDFLSLLLENFKSGQVLPLTL